MANNGDLKLIATLDESSSEAELIKGIQILNSKLKANGNAKIKLDADIDTKAIEKELQRLQSLLNQKTQNSASVNIKGKVDNKGIVTSIRQAMYQAQNIANKNSISVNFNIKKDKLINDIKILGQANSKLFKDANMASKYYSLLDNAKLATSNSELKNLRLQLSTMRSELKATNMSGLTLGDTFKKTFKRATELFTSTGVVMLLTQQLRNAWNESLNLDKSFTDLIKVQDELSRGDYPDYLEQCNKKAQELATTQQGLIDGATEFSKSGYDLTTSNKLTEKSTILANVGEMSASDSAKAIISGVQAYDVVDGYTDVVDKADALISKYNEIGNTASITTAEIAQGVQAVGSVFADANTSVDEFIAMLSAGNRQFQDADSLALGLRTAALRIRGCTTELQLMNEETDGVYTSASKLQEKIADLTNVDGSGGVKILEEDNETFRSIYDIFVDLSKVYQQMSDTDQSALLELIAGKHRASGISAVLNNMTEAQDIYERSLNSAGSAQEEYDKYLQSSEASLNKFKASMVETYQSVINGQTTKGILDVANNTLQFANSLGLVESTLKGFITIGIVKAITTLSTAFKASAISASNFGTALNTVKNMSTMTRGTTEYTNALKTLKTVSVGLSETQLKQVISNKALSNSERIAILQTTGLSKAQAKAKIAQMGLTQSTNAQTTANASATASTFSLTAAVKGFCVTLKSVFMSNQVGISIMALSLIIGAVSSKVSEYKEKLQETRQANMDAATTAKEQADSLNDLYIQYDKLNSITDRTSSQEEQFKQVVQDITKALGDKASALSGLTAGTDEYTASLKEATKAELESQYATAKIGAKAAEEELKDKTYSNWDGSQITIQQNEQMTGVEEHMAALEAVKDILAEYEDMGTYGLEWEPVNWDKNRNDMNTLMEYYYALMDAREKLVTADNADFLMSSDIYEDINTTINDLSESVEKYTEQQYQALKLNYEWQNGIPSTEEEFQKMEESILNASGAGKEFQDILKGYLTEDFSSFSNSISGIDDEINNALDDSSASVSTFLQAWSALENPSDETLKTAKDDLLKLAEAGQLSAESLKSVSGAEDYFEQIGLSAQDASNKINNLVTSASQLSSMREGITSITGALSEKTKDKVVSADTLGKFDVTLQGLDSWQEFEEVMGNSKSSMEECQQVANKLATDYVNSANFLSQLTEANKDYYVSQLTEMGVTNALEVVNASLANSENALAVAQSEVAKLCDNVTDSKERNRIASIDLANASASDIQALYNEATASGVATNGLRQLLAQKYNVNNLSVATASDCANLANLYSNSIAAANALNALAQAKANANSGKYVPHQQMEYMTASAQNAINMANKKTQVAPTVSVAPVSSGGSGGGGGGSSKSDSKTTIDWIARKLERLQKVIDATKSKFDNLFTVKSKSSNLDKQIKQTTNLMKAESKAASKYKKYADNVKLSKDLKKKVQSGDYNIKDYSSKTADKINKYKEYYDNYKEAKQQAEELKTTIRDLKEQKYQLYVDDAESNIDRLNAEKEVAKGIQNQTKCIQDQEQYIIQSYDYQIKIAGLTKDKVKQIELEKQKEKELLELKEEEYQLYVDDAESNIDKLNAQKDIAIGYQSQNSYIDQQKAYLKQSYDYQIKIAELTNDEVKKAQLQAEYQQKLRDYESEKFDNIEAYYSNQIGLLDNSMQSLDNKISEIEASGANVNKSYYESQKKVNDDIKKSYEEEKAQLEAQLPYITQGTDEWYKAKDSIQECDNKISDCVKTTKELNNAINELHFQMFEDIGDSIDRVITEQEFLRGLFAHEKKVDSETGGFTDAGIANLGSLSASYYLSKKKVKNDKAEVDELQRMYDEYKKTGSLNSLKSEALGLDYSTLSIDEFLEDFHNAIDVYQNDIKDTYSLESDIADAVKEKYQAELDLLDDLISKRKEDLSLQKDLHDYALSIQEKTTDINTIRKQIAALTGDTSQEGMSRKQKLQSDLETKQKDLKETEYERSIQTQTDMLTKLNEEANELMQKKMDDFMELVRTGLETANDNTANVDAYLSKIASQNGYTEETKGLFTGVSGTVSGSIETNAQNIVNKLEEDIKSRSGTETPKEEEKPKEESGEKDKSPSMSAGAGDSGSNWKDTALNSSNVQPPNTTVNAQTVRELVEKVQKIVPTNSNSNVLTNLTGSVKADEGSLASKAINYINKHANKTSAKKDDLSDLSKAIYKHTGGKVLTENERKKLADIVGVSYSGDNKNKKSGALYKKLKSLKISGFKRGGVIPVDSLGKQVKANGDSTLVSANPGERILTPVQNDLFEKFVNNLPELNQMTELIKPVVEMPKMPDIQPLHQPLQNNIQAEYNFTLENCTNAQDIINCIQKDQKVQKALRAVTTDEVMGKGRLGVNKIR